MFAVTIAVVVALLISVVTVTSSSSCSHELSQPVTVITTISTAATTAIATQYISKHCLVLLLLRLAETSTLQPELRLLFAVFLLIFYVFESTRVRLFSSFNIKCVCAASCLNVCL